MLLSSLKQLRSDYLERLSSENGKKSAKKQLGKGLQEYGRRNANSINRLILQCEKRISRFMTVKNSIDELSNSMRDSITAVIIWDYCAVDLSGELLIEFAKRLPVPEKGMLEMQIRARNLTALKASFMDHIQSVHGY